LSEIVSGTIYSDRRFFKGTIEFDNCTIIRVSENALDESGSSDHLILPLVANCHTHIGDRCLRGKIDSAISLEKIVQPPDGLKHVMLARASDDEITAGMASALQEMRRNGTGQFIDFREGGIRGIELFRKASVKLRAPRPIVLGRPKGMEYDEKEITHLLEKSDGIGVSAISDWRYNELRQIASHTRSKNKTFALHASEAKREDITKIMELEPDFLVHMSSASKEDLLICKEGDIPIIVCPRSNSRFNIPLDISGMIDLGLTVCLGTDNAMFNPLSIIDEMRAAHNLKSNHRRLMIDEVFKLAFENSRKIINDDSAISIRPGNPCNFMLVKAGKGLTPETLISTDVAYSIKVINSN